METLKTIPQNLGINLRERLLEFYDKYYSANIMTLVILGKESLDQLEIWAQEKFSAIPNKNVSIPYCAFHPLTRNYLQKKVYAVTVKDLKQLDLIWAFPDINTYFLTKPDRYLSHLLGHEGPGSLFSLLKNTGVANSLVAGVVVKGTNFSFFKVSVELTPLGLEKIDEITLMTFQYINMLKENGIQQWIFEECQKLAEISFRFKEKQRASSYTSRVAENMKLYPGDCLLSGGSLFYVYDPTVIQEFLDYLSPRNFKMMICSRTFENMDTFQKEHYYGTLYATEELSEQYIQMLENPPPNPDLYLPSPNEFIAENLEIKQVPPEDISDLPILIKETEISKVWMKKDSTFGIPKANLEILIQSPLTFCSPRANVMTTLFLELVKDYLNEMFYSAEVAGLRYSLTNNSDGIKISISGYDEKQKVLLQKIVEQMTHFETKEDRFLIIKEQLERSYRNFDLESPYERVMFHLTCMLQEIVWNDQQKLEVLKDMHPKDLDEFSTLLFSRAHFQFLLHGNLSRVDALEIVSVVENGFASKKLYPSEYKKSRAVQLSPGSSFLIQETLPNKENQSSAIEIFFQVSHYSDAKSRCLVELLDQVLKERFFDQLRTKEQLGYLVVSALRNVKGSLGLRFVIQSSFSPYYVEKRMEKFIQEQISYLSSLTGKDFQNYLSALIKKKEEKPRNLRQETDKYWRVINLGTYDFEHNKKELELVRQLTPQELFEFYQKFFVDFKTRSKASSISISQIPPLITQTEKGDEEKEEEEEVQEEEVTLEEKILVEDIDDFKASVSLYPLCRPERQ